jgi:hypothetical protein
MSGQNGQQSRSTFRSAAGDVAWQKQLRDRYEAEGVPPVPHLDIKRAIVRPVSRKLAEQIIFKYEWLGTMSNSSKHYGIFFGSFCAGVCCVAIGSGTAGTNVNKTYGIGSKEIVTLVRGACVHWAPPGTNSKLVAWTCKLLSKDTGAKLITAYSDTDAGEIGTIYQACNWICTGRTGSVRQLIAPSGAIRDEKMLHDWGKPRGMNKTQAMQRFLCAGWRVQRSNPKYRYVCVLDKTDKALVDRIERMRQPYPKRTAVHSADSGASPVQSNADEAIEDAPGTNQEWAVQVRPIRSNDATATVRTPTLLADGAPNGGAS